MTDAAAAGTAPLCRLDDIPDGGAKGFIVPGVADFGELFVVRRGAQVYAYVNSCPHVGTPLELVEDQFLNHDRTLIQCSTHGALFRIEDGYCVDGPCAGDALEPLPAAVRDGVIHVGG
jgi:nitrite reductase/ring-hydroxylating ferredoxin subunit